MLIATSAAAAASARGTLLHVLYAKVCHWNFGPGKIGPRTTFSTGKNCPPDLFFPEKLVLP